MLYSGLFRFLQKLLKGQNSPTSWQPLQRSAAELKAYAQWVQEKVYLNWLNPYFKAYHYSKAGLPPGPNGLRVQLVEGCGQHGALLFYDPSIGPHNFRHLFDLIRDRTLPLGYHLTTSDVRTRKHPRYTETIAKHFLKPNPTCCPETGRCEQRYGTVAVDMVSLNGHPGFIRVVCNPIQDALFCPAESFDKLMEAVFHVPAI
ncbi:hypothetical protein ASU33_15335 [Solirubrum puertoriconensis]|uniref:Uncharacterized protein n=1 Tax=Solirubrum puertoriconensis TaxID=1751427 RepID=A0A9X0HKL8_SOLP1|nr:hypothetical protein ASU33_15335 [Solirubrum puertoriconensis]